MTVIINAMAKEYGLLPTTVLKTASTLDFKIFITNRNYEAYRLGDTGQTSSPEFTQDQMEAALEAVRNEHTL